MPTNFQVLEFVPGEVSPDGRCSRTAAGKVTVFRRLHRRQDNMEEQKHEAMQRMGQGLVSNSKLPLSIASSHSLCSNIFVVYYTMHYALSTTLTDTLSTRQVDTFTLKFINCLPFW